MLGPVQVTGPDGTALLVGARQRAVVGLLAMKARVVVPRWQLVDALWGDDPPRTAVKSLHSHIARVRQALEACGLRDVLVTREPGYVLELDTAAVDAWVFEDRVRHGHEDLARGAPDTAIERLCEGLALWRHDTALADAEPTGWAAAEAQRLAEVRLTAITSRWDAELRLGRHATAIGELERLLVAHPAREPLVGLLMLALYRAGRHSAALEAYQRLRLRLADELGVDPGPELDGLHTLMLRRDPGLLLPGDRGGTGEPGRGSPPAAEVHPPMPRPAQLPARVGHFTGRGDALDALDALLADPEADTRLAVLSGPGGIGKTALAVQWAHRVADRFPDGQLFIDLRGHEPQSAMSPAEALSHLLRSLGVPGDRIPAEPVEQAALYRSLLHGRRVLIVLDNGGTADDILPLVPGSSTNLLLVTSRNALAALATHHAVCAVPLDVLAGDEAVALLGKLLGRAPVEREPEAAAELVRLCDGLPLALRIAAAKLAGQPRPAIGPLAAELAGADRLDVLTIDGGSRSVRAVFASAYRALTPPAARLFRLLGLHPGPTVHRHLAAAIGGLTGAATRRVLDELVAAHLVVDMGADRYRLHDLIAFFAAQCAVADEPTADRDEALDRLADWYLAVAHAANRAVDPALDRVTPVLRYAPEQLPFAAERHAALAFFDDERANLLPLARYTAGHGRPTVTWQLTYLLTGFYGTRGYWQERVELCQCAVAAAGLIGDPSTEGLMRSALGVARIMTHRFEDALESLHQALRLMQQSGDNRGVGHAYNNIAAAYSGLRRFDEAVEAFQHALRVHTANGYRMGIALALNNTGHTFVRMGRPELSADDLARALAISRELGSPKVEAAALHSLGEAHLRAGDPDTALEHLGEALAVYRRIGDRRWEAETLNGLGLAHLGRADHAAALSPLHQALLLSREIDDQHLEAVALHTMAQAYLAGGDLATAADQLRLALALRGRVPDAYEEAGLHRSAAEVSERSGDPEAARHHRALAVRLYRRANATGEADELAARPVPGVRPASSTSVSRSVSARPRPG